MLRKYAFVFFILPAGFLLGVFAFGAVAHSVFLSTLDWNLISPEITRVGWKNYGEVFRSEEFRLSLWNTLLYSLLFVGAIFVAPYGSAFLVTRVARRWQGVYKSLLFFPSILSLAVLSVIFLWLYNPLVGPLDRVFTSLGLRRLFWLTDRRLVVVALTIVTALKLFGYNFIVSLAGFLSVPAQIEEAALLDRASGWDLFFWIYCPLTSANAVFVLATAVVVGAQYLFVPIHMLTGGGPNYASSNLIFLIYQYGFQFFQSGKAAAVAVLTLLFFSGFIVVQAFLVERRVYYES